MTSTPDALAETARELALAALHEITPPTTVGPSAGYSVEESGAVSLRFQNRLPGYPGWFWTVTVAQVDDSEPTVLEVELMPGDGALLAPDWVPWAERLAEYRAHQAELAAQTADAPVDDSHEDDSEDDDSDDEHPEDDSDEDVSPRLHAGDVDGVDIDELDDSLDADASEESDDESEDDASEDDDESEDDESDDDDEDPDESE
ncbi:DUF3027 domain-containing protein [Microbacterium sp. Re1]|uniref:DUF3027 domain-containing protein n=1 Tax=Microbacterium commune TaxID=2762219 RepID=A0ABR8W638_9MICO|nr:DUF3027 domain-containing protein [Microbacterium commune]MBD8012482.1 DUF3027 domain-containing protein [Microbacterium commune]